MGFISRQMLPGGEVPRLGKTPHEQSGQQSSRSQDGQNDLPPISEGSELDNPWLTCEHPGSIAGLLRAWHEKCSMGLMKPSLDLCKSCAGRGRCCSVALVVEPNLQYHVLVQQDVAETNQAWHADVPVTTWHLQALKQHTVGWSLSNDTQ